MCIADQKDWMLLIVGSRGAYWAFYKHKVTDVEVRTRTTHG